MERGYDEEPDPPREVGDVMTVPVVTCRPDETLADAVDRMRERGVSCLPVVEDRDGRLVGILTDRDPCTEAVARGCPLERIAVASVMRSPVRTCWPNDSLEAAKAIMRAFRVRRLPVTGPSGEPVGLVSLSDIARRELARGSSRSVPTTETAETLAAIAAEPG